MYERDDRWLMSPQDEQDERSQFPARPKRVIIICEPFACTTFSELLLDQPIPLKMLAFAQLLQGIDALHSAGFIHRDIKLGNLGVVSISKTDLQIVILDYGQTIRASRCDPKPGAIGTVPYLAPEMEKSTYGHKVDIWASAIVGLQLFLTGGKTEWKNVVDEKARYMRRVQSLRGAPQDGIENLLAKMLAWDSLQRPTADDTLKHPCFRAVLDVINPQLGQKRRAPT
jgi:serine/threonine protein kinase